jgi:hydrogenase expression/formation protein HypE
MNEERILLHHGSGGRLSRDLVQNVILPAFDNPVLRRLEDASPIGSARGRMVMTTDSYVVQPLFFPGGDIGKLSICGTVNDLATAGATPVALSVGFIIEEGFALSDLRRILVSMKNTADSVPVPLVTGDTKVVEKTKGDGIYISTTGIGAVPEGIELTPMKVKPGDAVVINGPIGNHEASIICARNDFSLQSPVESDCAPLHRLMKEVIEKVPHTRCARDATRGGLASVLTEIIEASGYGIMLDEDSIHIDSDVQGICDILGMDPLFMANEGKMVIIVPTESARTCIKAIETSSPKARAGIIGEVHGRAPRLTVRTRYGTSRIVTMPMGTQLPRIC